MKYALLSVSNKSCVQVIGEFLSSNGYNLISSGGTAKFLQSNEIHVEEVSNFTQSPELLEGRVKTLHPRVHGSILQKNLENEYQNTLVDLDIVVCNLYPFEECLKKDLTHDDMLENIDIGGVALIRASAKNYKRVVILTHPSQYDEFKDRFNQNNITEEYRKELATKAFLHTSIYDSAITQYMSDDLYKINHYVKQKQLKYGANPHQNNASYLKKIKTTNDAYHGIDVSDFEVLNGKAGYINYLDAYGCWNLVKDLKSSLGKVASTSFKHTSPAGVSVNATELSDNEIETYGLDMSKYEQQSEAFLTYVRARNCDPKSSFGDFIGINTTVDLPLAQYLKGCVSDGIVASGYTDEALDILKSKKNGNYVVLKAHSNKINDISVKDYGTFSLSQEENTYLLDANKFDTNTILGMTTLKYTQSNSICFVYDDNVIGIGAGQQNRVDCVCLARQKAYVWFMRHNLECLKKLRSLNSFSEISNLDIFEKLNFDENNFVGKTKTERTNYIFDVLQRLYNLDLSICDLSAFGELFSQTNEINKKLTLCSDGFFPFTDSIEEGKKIGVNHVVHPAGSISDEKVKQYCDDNNIEYSETGIRYFYH